MRVRGNSKHNKMVGKLKSRQAKRRKRKNTKKK